MDVGQICSWDPLCCIHDWQFGTVLMKISSTASAVLATRFDSYSGFNGFIGSSVSSAAVVRAVSLS
jgi:hypothetical protein